MMLFPFISLLPLGYAATGLQVLDLRAIKESTDEWHTVDRLDIYQSLPSCAQPCVREVNQQIPMGSTFCQTYGCVCAESTMGPNFLAGLASVKDCAKRRCSSDKDVKAAEMGYQDICLVYAASSARTNTTQGSGTNITLTSTPGYQNLSSCAKFALTGCLDKDGNRNEANCGPLRRWQQWEEYRGIAEQRKCQTVECLCKQPEFDASFAVAYSAGERYCGMFLSTEALPNKDYEEMQNVFATFCTGEGYPPKTWWLKLIGQLLEGGRTVVNNHTSTVVHEEADGWNLENKLQLGLGAGIGIPALIANFFMLFLAWRTYRSTRKEAKRLEAQAAEATEVRVVT